jgi:hypothetical protein
MGSGAGKPKSNGSERIWIRTTAKKSTLISIEKIQYGYPKTQNFMLIQIRCKSCIKSHPHKSCEQKVKKRKEKQFPIFFLLVAKVFVAFLG